MARRRWTDEDLLNQLRSWLDEGGSGRIAGYKTWAAEHGKPGPHLITRRIGRWHAVLDQIGHRAAHTRHDWLRARNVTDRWSVREIGEELGVNRHRVLQLLERAGVPTRAHGLPIDVDELVRRYEAGETATALAREHQIALNAILKRLHKAGFTVRRGGRNEGKPSRLEDAAWLRRRYIEEDATITDIAREVGRGQTTVRAALLRHKIPLQPRKGRRTDLRSAGSRARSIGSGRREAE
jgi:AraC-like DNA-binding protein